MQSDWKDESKLGYISFHVSENSRETEMNQESQEGIYSREQCNRMYFEIQPQLVPGASIFTALQRTSGNSEM